HFPAFVLVALRRHHQPRDAQGLVGLDVTAGVMDEAKGILRVLACPSRGPLEVVHGGPVVTFFPFPSGIAVRDHSGKGSDESVLELATLGYLPGYLIQLHPRAMIELIGAPGYLPGSCLLAFRIRVLGRSDCGCRL